MHLLAQVDPDMYLIRLALQETGVNPTIVPEIVRVIGNIALGSGHGTVSIFMQKGIITGVNSEERILFARTQTREATLENEQGK